MIVPLFGPDHTGPRLYQDEHGRRYAGVTSCLGGNYTGPAWHALEGQGCHNVCLSWLAYVNRLEPEFEVPVCPPDHPNNIRWLRVMLSALLSFQQFVAEYQVEVIAIEHEVSSAVYHLVGHIDLLCFLRWHHQRVKAIVDLKFVRDLSIKHEQQVRLYGVMVKDAQFGFVYKCDRDTGKWSLHAVNLTVGLAEVMAAAAIAQQLTEGT